MLRNEVRRVLVDYFSNVKGEMPTKFYDSFMSDIEKPMLEFLIERTRCNVTKMAEIMGVTRNTLYKKLKKYGFN